MDLFDLSGKVVVVTGGTRDIGLRIINIGSIDGLRVPGLPTYAYSASKCDGRHRAAAPARAAPPVRQDAGHGGHAPEPGS